MFICTYILLWLCFLFILFKYLLIITIEKGKPLIFYLFLLFLFFRFFNYLDHHLCLCPFAYLYFFICLNLLIIFIYFCLYIDVHTIVNVTLNAFIKLLSLISLHIFTHSVCVRLHVRISLIKIFSLDSFIKRFLSISLHVFMLSFHHFSLHLNVL